VRFNETPYQGPIESKFTIVGNTSIVLLTIVGEEVVKNLEIPTPYEQLESSTKTNIVFNIAR
jgi:hypothetical protein